MHTLSLLKSQGDLTATEIEAALGITQAAVSRQMKVLLETGLVGARRHGKWLHYTINREAAGLVPGMPSGTAVIDKPVTLTTSLRGRIDRLVDGHGEKRARELRGSLEVLRGVDLTVIRPAQAKAIANRERLMMLALVNIHDKITATELAVVFHLTPPTVNGHLEVLEKAGFLDRKAHGKWTWCSATNAAKRILPVLDGEDRSSPFRNGEKGPKGSARPRPRTPPSVPSLRKGGEPAPFTPTES